MHLVVINGSPRIQAKSNTEKILTCFLKGFSAEENTYEIWRLSDRKQWENPKVAFAHSADILFALPLFVENIPGIMLEFLEELPPKTVLGTRMAFLLQGGFPEASQLRCCESFLETLPKKLGCEYAGTLLHGDMFGIRMMPEKLVAPALTPFMEAGRRYGETGCFSKAEADVFAGPELLPPATVRKFNLLGKPMQKLMMNRIAKSWGCKEKLDARPYGSGDDEEKA